MPRAATLTLLLIAGFFRAEPAAAEPPQQAPVTLSPAAQPAPRISDEAFQAELRRDDLDRLEALCSSSAASGDSQRLQALRRHLLERPLQPITLAKVLANAEVLLRCRAPAAALSVLDRFSPERGPGRQQWLLLQWRAATANLDHRLAARALERLSAGQVEQLAALKLPLQRGSDGPAAAPAQRAAIDLLAADLESRGRRGEAAARLIAVTRLPGISNDPASQRLAAERLQWAVALLETLPPAERERLLEPALELAAAAGAWGLVGEMLDQQLTLDSKRALERRLRLSPRLDDAYGEWRLRRQSPTDAQRTLILEQQLRSPRAEGGHAATTAEVAPAEPPAAAPPDPSRSRPLP